MEQEILAKLKPLVSDGRIEPAMFFRVCALVGVPFSAAMAVVSSIPAFANTPPVASAAKSSYADLVDPYVVTYITDVAVTIRSGEADPFDDNYFVKKSGEPFSKFDKKP